MLAQRVVTNPADRRMVACWLAETREMPTVRATCEVLRPSEVTQDPVDPGVHHGWCPHGPVAVDRSPDRVLVRRRLLWVNSQLNATAPAPPFTVTEVPGLR
ncbi:hypothetical protein [Micromonospora arida]|uniref:hypothetical protein n=1 Tax=Micromonospora arida TaxID=2203715 RepID=UPI0033AB4306